MRTTKASSLIRGTLRMNNLWIANKLHSRVHAKLAFNEIANYHAWNAPSISTNSEREATADKALFIWRLEWSFGSSWAGCDRRCPWGGDKRFEPQDAGCENGFLCGVECDLAIFLWTMIRSGSTITFRGLPPSNSRPIPRPSVHRCKDVPASKSQSLATRTTRNKELDWHRASYIRQLLRVQKTLGFLCISLPFVSKDKQGHPWRRKHDHNPIVIVQILPRWRQDPSRGVSG